MRSMRMGVLTLGAMSLLAAGCQNKMHDENQALWKQNRELQTKLSDSEGKLRTAPDPNAVATMQGELAARDAKIAELEGQLKQQPAGQPKDDTLSGIEVTRDTAAGTMTVNLPGDVLFPSGQTVLKDSAKSTLDKVVKAIKKDYSGKKIIVRGHTDTDPISKTKDKWEDNLDLSAARARTVEQYLQSQGLPNGLVDTQAWGATSPRGGKAQSRRVEIVVATR